MSHASTPNGQDKTGMDSLESMILGDLAPQPRPVPPGGSDGGDQLTMTEDGRLTTHITLPGTVHLLPRRLEFVDQVPPPGRPGAVARLIAHMLADDEGVHLKHWRDSWYVWRDGHTGGRYRAFGGVDNKYAVPDMLRSVLEHATFDDGKNIRPWDPNNRKVREVADALAAFSRPDETMSAGTWIGNDAERREAETPGHEITCVANGLLWCPTGEGGASARKLMPHSPAFFTDAAVAFPYEPEARCPLWLKFLGELWPGDEASQSLLQEWFGYVLTRSTALQKILVITGPKRSGKGTIAWVLEALLGGRSEVDHPMMSTLADTYGLSNMLGKRLAIFGDARMGKSDSAIVEKLLMISGEDPVTVQRKYLSAVVTKLDVRLMILSNSMPDLRDTTGALASRFLPLPIKIEGFFGKEDKDLKRKLGGEMSGILRWALEGADRLWANDGRFTLGDSVRSAMEQAERQGSPLRSFVMDRLEFDPTGREPKDSLYMVYQSWCEAEGFHALGKNVFYRQLNDAYPHHGLTAIKPRIDGRQIPCLAGVRLRSDW